MYKKGKKKLKDPLTIKVVGQLANFMSKKVVMEKYVDPITPIVTIFINNVFINNTLIDLGVSINIVTITIMEKL